MFVPGNARPLRAIYKNCPMTCLLGCPKHLEPDPWIPLNPRFLRGVNVNVLKPFIIDRVTSRLVTGHLLPPGLRLTTCSWPTLGSELCNRAFPRWFPDRCSGTIRATTYAKSR